MPGPTHLAVGILKKPHGVKGDCLVFPLTDDPESVFAVGHVLVVLDRQGEPTGGTLTVTRGRAYQRAWLLHFEGMDDRTALEVLRERCLGVTVGEARPLGEGEFYLHELVGLRVELKDRTLVGTVREVYEAPQGYLLSVARAAGTGPDHLVPFVPGLVRRVERGERMVIEPPEGLLEL